MQEEQVKISTYEARILLACIMETREALEDWELEIRVGLSPQRLIELRDDLKNRVKRAEGKP